MLQAGTHTLEGDRLEVSVGREEKGPACTQISWCVCVCALSGAKQETVSVGG